MTKFEQARNEEPVALTTALNAALASTWGVIVIAADVDSKLSGAVTLAIAAWVGLAGAWTRARTTPSDAGPQS